MQTTSGDLGGLRKGKIWLTENEILNGIKIDTNSSYTAKDVFLEIEKRLEKSRKAEKEAAECGMYQKASEAQGVYFELLDILEYFGQEL